MFYASTIVLSFILITHFMGRLLHKKANFSKNYSWLLAIFFVVIGSILLSTWNGGVTGNLIQHSMGGGVATALGYFYIKKQLRLSFRWQIELTIMLGMVSLLGNINEMLEFAADVAGYGPFSFDRFDTWRDIVANTTGAIICFLVVKTYRRFFTNNRV